MLGDLMNLSAKVEDGQEELRQRLDRIIELLEEIVSLQAQQPEPAKRTTAA